MRLRAPGADAPRLRSSWLLAAALLSATCGGKAPVKPAVAPVEAKDAAASPPQATPAPAKSLPTACADGSDAAYCLPPQDFVKRLCASGFPTVALTMFRKGTPWTRAYLTRTTDAWNASGGAASNDKLVFDEEVIVLTRRVPDTGGMVVSGASGGFDVLRWDGSCASLEAGELSTKAPPKPKSAAIPWRILEDGAQKALRSDEKIGKIDAERRRECKGVTMGDVSAKCERADRELGVAVAEYVRGGGELPEPARLP